MFNSLVMRGLSAFLFLIHDRTEKESEWMINLFELLVKTLLSGCSLAQVSAVNMEDSFGRHFFLMFYF